MLYAKSNKNKSGGTKVITLAESSEITAVGFFLQHKERKVLKNISSFERANSL